jgi:hypothetical protein
MSQSVYCHMSFNFPPRFLSPSPLHLTSVYMDTTFCEPRAVYIPSRAESARAASDIASEWLAHSLDHNVLIAHKAGLGYEHLYREMAAELGMKVRNHNVLI